MGKDKGKSKDSGAPKPSKMHFPKHQGKDGNEVKPGAKGYDPKHGTKVPRHAKPKNK